MAPFGVRVYAVSLGRVRTNLLGNSDQPSPVSWNDFIAATILDRVAEPTEIDESLLFLASDKAFITGSNDVSDNDFLLK